MATQKKTTSAGELRVRMYRQGLGDCFLITIPTGGAKPFYMMIDCGVVLGSSAEAVEKLRRAVEDVIAVTGGEIDVLVATHEHWDHVSGFAQARELFEKSLKVKQVWVAWTEDPKDKLAARLRDERRTAESALRMAATHLAMNGSALAAEHVDSLVGFFGATRGATPEAMDFAKQLGAERPRYCQPGEPPIELPGVAGVRVWVLGPPKDEKRIKKSNPGQGEAYGLDASAGGSQAFLVSALQGSAEGETLSAPFDSVYAIPMERAEKVPFFASRYYHPKEAWRRIDSTWMDAAETMALQLDSATNNTSLVLAIEIVRTGEVLLFPGDAQAGSWLSWQDLHWEKEGVTGPDLLARTVFYKVGHHGSHNATLKEKGLELMTSDDLMAMIPVDHAMAVKKRWGRMPLPELVDRLAAKTQGRLLRVDQAANSNADLESAKPAPASDAVWKRFTERVTVTPNYFELRFGMGAEVPARARTRRAGR